ncbi:MAG: hypothetical protein ACLQVF_11670 [Isosphaeraceae bacterium]
MSSISATLRGFLNADGSLQLEDRPEIPPGPVEVTIRALPEVRPSQPDWWAQLQEARARRERAGHPFRSRAEIDAEIAEGRADREL